MLALVSTIHAQSGPVQNLTGFSNCTQADFDTTLQFLDAPEGYFTILVNRRNLCTHACVFDGPMYGPSFVPDRVEGEKPIELCYYCDERLPNGQVRITPPLSIEPGQTAQQTIRWRTTPLDASTRCVQPQWMSDPLLVAAPSLLKKICSPVEVNRFRLIPADSTLVGTPEQDKGAGIILSSDRTRYFQGESFSVRVASMHLASRKDELCPTLYLRQRSPDGETRVDEVHPLAFAGCGAPVLGHQVGDWQSGFDIDSGANSKWLGVGEHALQVFRVSGSTDSGEVRFESSNVLRLQIADGSLIERKWTSVRGIAADITLDKDTFRLGEDVPLHMAIADLSAEAPIYGSDPVWDPCMVLGIAVKDSAGRQLSVDQRFMQWSICTGHGFGLKPYPKGTVIPVERTLGKEGWLPNRPGTYIVVLNWAPCTPSNKKHSGKKNGTEMKPYATVEATATIHIVAENQAASTQNQR